jgi:hypothetical protein
MSNKYYNQLEYFSENVSQEIFFYCLFVYVHYANSCSCASLFFHHFCLIWICILHFLLLLKISFKFITETLTEASAFRHLKSHSGTGLGPLILVPARYRPRSFFHTVTGVTRCQTVRHSSIFKNKRQYGRLSAENDMLDVLRTSEIVEYELKMTDGRCMKLRDGWCCRVTVYLCKNICASLFSSFYCIQSCPNWPGLLLYSSSKNTIKIEVNIMLVDNLLYFIEI